MTFEGLKIVCFTCVKDLLTDINSEIQSNVQATTSHKRPPPISTNAKHQNFQGQNRSHSWIPEVPVARSAAQSNADSGNEIALVNDQFWGLTVFKPLLIKINIIKMILHCF